MKTIGIDIANPKQPNKVYAEVLDQFVTLFKNLGYNIVRGTAAVLPLNCDGYVFLPYLYDSKAKINAILNRIPFISISSEFINREKYGHKYVRLLINGNTPGWGVWNHGFHDFSKPEGNPFKMEKKEFSCRSRLLLTPTAASADINFGQDPMDWARIVSAKLKDLGFNFLSIKPHPKIKNSSFDYSKNLASLGLKVLGNPAQRNLRNVYNEFDVCVNYTSTASVEAAILGKTVFSSCPGDFMYLTEDLDHTNYVNHLYKTMACLCKPTSIDEWWEYNEEFFINNQIDITYPKYLDQITTYFKSL